MSTGTMRRGERSTEGLVTASSSRETRETMGLQVIGEGRTLETSTPFYVVPSRTEAGKLYLVYRFRTRLQCTCMAGRFDTVCCHRVAVRNFLLERGAPTAAPEPSAPSPPTTASPGRPPASRPSRRSPPTSRPLPQSPTAPSSAPSPAQHPGDTAPLRREPFSFLKR